jgi:hypothetical protein
LAFSESSKNLSNGDYPYDYTKRKEETEQKPKTTQAFQLKQKNDICSNVIFEDVRNKQKNNFPFENVAQHMAQNKKFDPLLQSSIFWDEKKVVDPGRPGSLMNASGAGYNFVMNTRSRYPDHRKLMEINPEYAYKQKSISEIADLQTNFHFHRNADYQEAANSDKSPFNSLKGLCATELKANSPFTRSFKKYKYA